MVYCVYQQKFYRCVPLSSLRSGFLIQDPLNHGALKRPLNPIWTRIHQYQEPIINRNLQHTLWSEWSYIINPDVDQPKGMHPIIQQLWNQENYIVIALSLLWESSDHMLSFTDKYRKWLIKRRGTYFIFPVIGAVLIRERRLFESSAYFKYG